MNTIEVIPYVFRRHKETGKKISKFSVLPYGSRDDWETISKGYTWGMMTAEDYAALDRLQQALLDHYQVDAWQDIPGIDVATVAAGPPGEYFAMLKDLLGDDRLTQLRRRDLLNQ